MDCQPAPARRHWILPAAALIVAAITGCQNSDEIVHYRVPKEQEVSLSIDVAETAGSENSPESADNTQADRMLAAIVPHGNTAWFFKLSGPADAVGKHADTFESLVKSIDFPKSAGGKPTWTLPNGWQQKPGSQMRFATLVLPSEAKDAAANVSTARPLEVSVTSLPWSARDNAEQLLANVNRWRGQMQLKTLAAADLPQETKSLELPGEAKITATLVDLTGHMKAGGMQPPFANAAAGRPDGLPPGHPDVSNRLPPGHPSVVDEAASNRPPMASAAKESTVNEQGHPSLTAHAVPDTRHQTPDPTDSDLPFTFTVPSSWKSAALPTFAVAAFAVSDNSSRPEVTITPLPESAAGISANINRWRGQLGLQPASEDELKMAAQTYQVDGQSAHLVRLVGPEDANPRRVITAMVVPHDGINWIFALKADAAVADQQQANFEKFVGSVKFQQPKK